MKRIVLALCLSAPVFGQAVVGLYGPPDAPIVVNHHATKNIVAVVIIQEADTGQTNTHFVLLTPPQTDGIASGDSLAVFGQNVLQITTEKGVFKPVYAQLDGVVFADGEFVGPDTANSMDRLQSRLAAKVEVGDMVHNGDWLGVEKISSTEVPPPTSPHIKNGLPPCCL